MSPEPDRDARPGTRADRPSPFVVGAAAAEMAALVVALFFGGWWADGKLGTTPWLAVTGAVLGFGVGLYNLWKQAKRFLK